VSGLTDRLPLAVALATLWACAPRWAGAPVEPPRAAADLGGLRMAEQRGKVVVLTFGFTSCPDVCPLTLSRLRAAWRLLGDDAARVTGAFVSVDPERDAPERLRDYVAGFDARFLAVHLPAPALADGLAAYGATATRRLLDPDRYRHRPGAPPRYTVDHTAGFLVVDKRGLLRLRHPHDVAAEDLARDLRRLLAEPDAPGVRVEGAVAHLTRGGVGAVYLRIVNPSGADDRLVGVESAAAERVELHESVRSGDVVGMRPRDAFEVPAGGSVELARGGKHLMLMGVAGAARSIPVTLRFERAGALSLEVGVAEVQ
jgi:protein SCO1/2